MDGRMKTFTQLSLFFISLLLIYSCNTWTYQHPRVRVEKMPDMETTERLPVPKADLLPRHIEEEKLALKSEEKVVALNEAPSRSDNTRSKTADVTTTKHKTIKDQVVKHHNYKSDYHLNKVKQTQKTALSGWLKIMIILFVVGVVLIVIGAILAFAVGHGVWWIFYALGGLCILAGCIVLLLGLLGVMH